MNKAAVVSDPIVEGFKALNTPCVSDAMDKLGIDAGCQGIKQIVIGTKFVGRAFTVKYRACGVVERGTVGDFLDDVLPGQVIVLDNSGRTDCTVWGDIMTAIAHHQGIAGTVIDGVCRDIPKIRELAYPIFTRDYFMMTGKDRVEIEAVNVPVTISKRQVRPGDILMGDDTGVIVIPASRAEEILKVSQDIEVIEIEILRRVEAGESLRAVREDMKYHALQTPASKK